MRPLNHSTKAHTVGWVSQIGVVQAGALSVSWENHHVRPINKNSLLCNWIFHYKYLILINLIQ